MSKKYVVILNDNEKLMLEKLVSERGYRIQEIFRLRLRDLFRKEFPPYNEAKKKEEWYDKYTNEEFCVHVKGGEVIGDVCVIPTSNGGVKEIPISRVKVL